MVKSRMATIQEIEQLFDTKLVAFREQILKDIDAKWKQIIETNQKNIAANSTSIEGINLEIETIKRDTQKQIDDLKNKLIESEQEIDEITNRSMRTNVIIKGIPEVNVEDWDVTKDIVAETLATLSNENPETIARKLDRVHRGGKKEGKKPRHIYANFIYSTDASYYVSLAVKKAVDAHNKREPAPTWRMDHQYSKKLTERRDKALVHRKELMGRKEYVQCKLVYPAKLLGRKDKNVKKWDFVKEF